MEPLLLLRGVREVSVLASPISPESVSQRAFDDARARSPEYAGLPAARRITEQLQLAWREVLQVTLEPVGAHSFLLGRKGTEQPVQSWLTAEYVAFALKLVARRLRVDSLTPSEYRVERGNMLRADRVKWLHGRQLLLPNENQVRTAAGSWDAALSLAGLSKNVRGVSQISQPILSRVDVMDRFYDAYQERPTERGLYAFARGNKLPMGGEQGRSWSDAVAAWEARRRQRGLPAPRVVKRTGGRGQKAPDYSRDVGAAQPGEQPYRNKWGDPDACVTWVVRYLQSLQNRERSTARGYEDWARQHEGAPRASRFEQHGGWEAMRRQAQQRAGGP